LPSTKEVAIAGIMAVVVSKVARAVSVARVVAVVVAAADVVVVARWQ
jgi:hypothetical protein